MWIFEVLLLILGFVISIMSILRENPDDKKYKFVFFFKKRVSVTNKLLGWIYVVVLGVSIVVIVNKLQDETTEFLTQKSIFQNVNKMKGKVDHMDSLVNTQLDLMNIVLDSTSKSASALIIIDSLMKNSIFERGEILEKIKIDNNKIIENQKLNLLISNHNRLLTTDVLTRETGGNSYPIIVPMDMTSRMFDRTKIRLEIINIGIHSQKNVIVYIRDHSRYLSLADQFGEQPINTTSVYEYKLGDLALSGIRELSNNNHYNDIRPLTLTNGVMVHEVELEKNQKNLILQIIIESNNGTFKEELSISNWNEHRGFDQRHKMNLELFKIGHGELFHYIGLEFPKINDSVPTNVGDPYKIYE